MLGNFSIPTLTSETNYYNIYQIDTRSASCHVNISLPQISDLDNAGARSFYISDIG